jgi:hypothetical protein
LFELSIEYVVDGDERKRPRKARGSEHLDDLYSRSKMEDAIEKCFLRALRGGAAGITSLRCSNSCWEPDEHGENEYRRFENTRYLFPHGYWFSSKTNLIPYKEDLTTAAASRRMNKDQN